MTSVSSVSISCANNSRTTKSNALGMRPIHEQPYSSAITADLYDPEAMPDDLRRAHEVNDEVLERTYTGRRFRNDTERLERLFELYSKMTGKKAA